MVKIAMEAIYPMIAMVKIYLSYDILLGHLITMVIQQFAIEDGHLE